MSLQGSIDSNSNKSCTELASELSRNFRNVTSVQEQESISSYLSSHGILLTMCFPWACAINIAEQQHVAASWINAAIGPTHVIPAPSNMGLVLDPAVAHIDCIYPTDGGTDARDGQGCGPIMTDPKYGSQGAASQNVLKRWYLKRLIHSYKDFNFAHTDWEDILCEDFFGRPHLPSSSKHLHLTGSPQIFWKWDDDDDEDGHNLNIMGDFDSIVFESYLTVLQNTEQAMVGHPVCSVPDPTPAFEEAFLIYYGKEGLSPNDWNYVVDTQQHLISRFPNTQIWNEMVLKLPSRLEDIVQAVFYVDSPEMSPELKAELRQRAERQARLFGNKPLLKVDLMHSVEEGGDLLVCDDEKENEDEVPTSFESSS